MKKIWMWVIGSLFIVSLIVVGCGTVTISKDGRIEATDYIFKYTEGPNCTRVITGAPKSTWSASGIAEVIGAIAPIVGPFLGPDGQPAYLVHGMMVPATPQGMRTQQPCPPCNQPPIPVPVPPQPYPSPMGGFLKKN